MAKKLDNTIVQSVYYRVRRDDTSGEMLYRKAPFELVMIAGMLHILPWVGGMNDQALTLLAADSAEDQNMWRMDIGYETLNPVVLTENQMGDGSDSWLGLHSISNI